MRRLRHGSEDWRRFLEDLPRAGRPRPRIERAVARIVDEVRREGDRALVRWTARLDGITLSPADLRVPAREVRALARAADPAVVQGLRAMAGRIRAYHRRQADRGFRMRLRDGSTLEELVRPLASAGLYVPGGAGAYPSSVLMNAIPARLAGVPRLVVATPPQTLERNPAVAAALVEVGLEAAVVRVGGAQAVAALAYGTPRVPAVAKIVGPGNAYVAAAKRQVRGRVEIDQDAGPSEVVILADGNADPSLVAADLLAQAEHGSGEETVVLVTPSPALMAEVERQVAAGVARVANPVAARRALRVHGALVLVRDMEEGVVAVNALAPEHAQVLAAGASRWARRLVAGAVFAGAQAPVAVGDYGIGPNHVLPTGGTARHASPLSVRDFQRRQSVVHMTPAGLRRVRAGMAAVAAAEGFPGHARSLFLR